jgi:hypothetical protein
LAEVFKEPEGIKVTANVKGVPISLSRKGKREKITAIYDSWYSETEKDYFMVKTSRGLVYDIYHDIANKCWYLAKIYD